MNWKHILGSGATSGAMIAMLMIVNVISGVTEFGFELAMLSFLAVILIPPFLTRKIWEEEFNIELRLSHLIPVSFLTFIIPILGPAFGGSSMSLEWMILIPMGAAGGALWSLPFAAWSKFRGGLDSVQPSSESE